MTDLGELYAACIVDYASRQPNGLLSGEFYVFGKQARDAYNLPFDATLFDEAFEILTKIGVLTTYRHKKMFPKYSVRYSDFTNAMIVEGNGSRRYEKLLSAASAATSAISAATLIGRKREPTLLEAYSDLGSDYLHELLEVFEPELATIGADGPGEMDAYLEGTTILDNAVDEDGDTQIGQLIDRLAPASDREILFTDNQDLSSQLAEKIVAINDAIGGSNALDPEEKSDVAVSLNSSVSIIQKSKKILVGAFRYLVLERIKKAFEKGIEDIIRTTVLALLTAFVTLIMTAL